MLLLPGLAALLGFYSPSKLSRDVVAQGALVQLGVLISVSFFIHIPLLLLLKLLSQFWPWFEVDLSYVFAAMDTAIGREVKLAELDQALDRSILRTLLYFLIASSIGWWAGRSFGKRVVAGYYPSVALHSWAFQLVGADDDETGVTFAYVMTNVRHEEKILIYRGALDEFHIGRDGKISYIVLRDSARFYMKLEDGGPETTAEEHRKIIGDGEGILSTSVFRFMMIEGEDIANLLFHRFSIEYSPAELKELDERVDQLLMSRNSNGANSASEDN